MSFLPTLIHHCYLSLRSFSTKKYYKATSLESTAKYGNKMVFEEGKDYNVEGNPVFCANGFHYVEGDPKKVLSYYKWPFLLWEVGILGKDINSKETIGMAYDPEKSVTNWIWMKKKIGEEETKELLTEVRTTKWSNGKVHEEGKYVCGERHGPYKEYYPDGKLSEKGYWNWGRRDGSFVEYSNNGNVLYRKHYINGMKHGEFIKYTPTGRVEKKRIYVEGKRLDYNQLTEKISYYPNGSIESKDLYFEGKKVGTHEVYHKNGNKFKCCNYYNGMCEDKDC